MTVLHVGTLVTEGRELRDVRLDVADGRIAAIAPGSPAAGADLRLGVAVPGSADAHSHAFHRALRGRAHDPGDFWSWRREMYRLAAVLDPPLLERLASAVFAELLAAGYTAVAEFHYLHHAAGGARYADPNETGHALIRAARSVGIRLTLLDTLYLESAPGVPLTREQLPFGDGDADAWLARWTDLARGAGPGRGPAHPSASDGVTIGAAIHSLRAVPPGAVRRVLEGLPADAPLHLHLSEQPAENDEVRAAYGASPTRLLADTGALDPRLSVVHATHLGDDDIRLLGDARVTAVLCPTTEQDLGDGIGPARALADAGASLAIGSDQNVVVDPFRETRDLEMGQRLAAGRRGMLSPAELDAARSASGYRAIGHPVAGMRVGAPADLVELDDRSVRTAGSALDRLVLTATAADATRVVVGGRVVAERGLLADGRDPARMIGDALRALEEVRR